MQRRTFCWLLCVPCLAASACSRQGAETRSSDEALQILSAASEFYRGQPGVRVESRLEAVIHDDTGERIEGLRPLIDSRTLVVRPSNRYVLQGNEFRLASDGTALRIGRMLSPDPAVAEPSEEAGDPGTQPPAARQSTASDVYFRTEAPARPLDLAGLSIAPLFGGPANLRMLSLLDPGLSDALLADGLTVVKRGTASIDGKSAHHLEIKEPLSRGHEPRPMAVTQVWIAAEGDPLVLQIKHMALPQRMSFGRTQIEAVVVSTETFGEWEFGADEPDATFAALPGSRRVAGLGQILQPASPLLGKPAPDTVLPLVDGSTVSLSELKGEGKIVLLDFWATWCAPCLTELPFVAGLAREFAGDGVVLYAVNQGESAAAIKTFQLNQSFQFTAALDESGALSTAFGVTGIPHLCIIGRDGTVQVVHVGVGADTEAAIRAELTALTAGRSIAAEGLPD